jgi:integrase
VLAIELPWLDGIVRAKTPSRLPVVLTRAETAALLVALCGTHRLVGELLYGTGMRILEALRLRVKDVDFVRREIVIRNLKGAKDRVTMLSDRDGRWIREPISSGATTSATNHSSARCARRCARRESPSPRRRIRFDIRSLRICSRPGATSAPCRSSWGTRM